MWLVYSLSAALAFGLLLNLQRVVAINSKNYRAGAMAFNLVSSIIALALFLATNGVSIPKLPESPDAYGFLLLGLVSYGLFERIRFKAADAIEASEYAVIGNISILVSYMLSIWIYNEPFTFNKAAGFLLIVSAALLVSVKGRLNLFKKGVGWAVTAELILGIAMASDKMGADNFGPGLYNILCWSLPLAVLYFPSIKADEIVREFKLGPGKIVLLALLNVAGYFLSLKAFVLTEATKALPVMQTSVLVAVILGVIVLKERDDLMKKLVAAGVALAGVRLIAG